MKALLQRSKQRAQGCERNVLSVRVVETTSSREAWALAAICLPMSCRPVATIWLDLTSASKLP